MFCDTSIKSQADEFLHHPFEIVWTVVSQPEQITLSLERGGPWGVGFLPPQFDGQFELVDARVFAHKHLRMTLRHPGGEKVRAVWFNAKQLQLPKQLHLVYTLEIDRWKDRQSLQLRVLHVEQDRPAADA